jgi:hypothetical protein
MSCRRLVVVFVVAWVLCGAAPAQAQFFRNNGISVLAGWKGLGSTWDGATGEKIWNISDQGTIGMGYFTALDYNWFWDIAQVEIGIGAEELIEGRPRAPMFSVTGMTGVRYNFLEERVRPFVSGHVQYLQLIPVTPDPDIPNNTLTNNFPFWVGARVGGGCEFFLIDEVSLLAHAGLTAFTGLNSPPKEASPGITNFLLPQANAGLTAHIYF